MDSSSDKVKYSQVMFLVAGFILGSSFLLSFMDNTAQHDFFLVLIAGFALSIPLIWAYSKLSQRFPDKDLIQICEIVYGKIIGRIIAALYVFYFLLILALNLKDLAGFYTGFLMQETPLMVFIIVFTLICGYAVKKGADSIVRMSFLSVIFGTLTALTTFLFLIDKMDLSNFLPILELPADKFIQTTHIFTVIPFGETVALLMLLPSMKKNKKITKYMISGAVIATFIFLFVVVRNTAVLGPSASMYAQTSFQSVRLINFGEFFSRIEVLIAMVLTVNLFIKISVLYYATVNSFSRLLRIQNSGPLILPLGSIAIVLAFLTFDSTVVHADWGSKYAALFTTPFTVILPLLTLLLSKLRKLPNGKQDSI